MVRAKFTVVSKTENADGGFYVKLQPVVSGSDENKEFYKWTPGGELNLSTINKAAADAFKPGKSYYLDFTEAT
jgi:hypothetical protein